MTQFWQEKALEDMTEQEGLPVTAVENAAYKPMDEDTEEIYYTNVACSWLNSKTCSCKDYPNRFSSGEECTKLTRDDIDDFTWLPHTCAYRLLAEDQPLLNGTPC